MNRFMPLFIVSYCFLLTGCMTPEQRAARNAQLAAQAQQQAQMIEARKQQYCASMGAPIGSDKYYDCRKWIEQELANEQNLNAAAAMQAMQFQQQQEQQQNIARQQQYQQQMNAIATMNSRMGPGIRCTSTPIGGTVNTDCY